MLMLVLTLSQKAAKQQASRNTAILRNLHLVSFAINAAFILLRFAIFRSSWTRATYILYLLFSAPALAIEVWFERNGRPQHLSDGQLKKTGDDLEAKGLTEYMFDVLYWSWGTTAVASVFGDKAWWMWLAIPLYSVWLAYSTFGSVRQGMAGIAGAGGDAEAPASATSNRQKKMEKRGGQKMQYR